MAAVYALQPARRDNRDYQRGVKRSAKEFRKALRRQIGPPENDTVKAFDHVFRIDIDSIFRYLSYSYEAVNSVGLHRSPNMPVRLQQGFLLFHESLNLLFVSLRNARGGSVLASDGVLRQAIELASVAFDVVSDSSGHRLKDFTEGRLKAPKSVSVAKKTYAPIGRLYGDLSNSAVHASVEHTRHSVSMETDRDEQRRIRVGAWFDPEHSTRFKLGLIRIVLGSVAVLALIEAGFISHLEAPRLWKKTSSGPAWAGEPELEALLREAEKDQRAIEDNYSMVYPWVDPKDLEEVQRLMGTTAGAPLDDVARLQAVTRENPDSFIGLMLLGHALDDAGDPLSAAANYERAWARRPDGYDVWSRLERIYMDGSDPAALKSFYERSLEREPNHYTAIHNLGRLYSRLGQEEQALICYQKAHALKPDRYWPLYNTANSLLHLDRFLEATEAYRDAATREPSFPEPWHSAGVAYMRMKDFVPAYRSFRRAVLLDNGFVASWVNLASVCRILGYLRRAEACALRAQSLAPGDDRIEGLISTIRTEIKIGTERKGEG